MTINPHRRRAGLLAVTLMLAACSSIPTEGSDPNSDLPSPTSTSDTIGPQRNDPSPTASPPATAITVEPSTTSGTDQTTSAAIQSLLDGWAAAGSGGVAVALANRTTPQLTLAAGSNGPDGAALQPDAEFRVGSLTKTFVTVMVLQLLAEGQIGLDDLVTQHLPGLTIADGVTIRQVLAHRSGIPEHADDELAPAVLADPAKAWTPTDVLALVEDQPRDLPPGDRFAYSNTDYVIAGMLLEQITQRSMAGNLDTRVVEPLGLHATYFAPDPERQPIGGFSLPLPGFITATEIGCQAACRSSHERKDR